MGGVERKMVDKLVIYENKNYRETEGLLNRRDLYVVFVDWTTNDVYVLVEGNEVD